MEPIEELKTKETIKHLFSCMFRDLEWLKSHNKNYNKTQYFKIDDTLENLSTLYDNIFE